MAQDQILVFVATAIALLAAAVYRSSTHNNVDAKHPATKLPWVGVKNGILPSIWERIASMTNLPALMQEGYAEVSWGFLAMSLTDRL